MKATKISKINTKKGFTIHELMVSLFLINMVAFSMLSVVTMLLKSSQDINQDSKAAIAASSILDKYIAGEIENPENKEQITGSEEFSDQTFYYIIDIKRAREASNGVPEMKQISVRVSASENLLNGKLNNDDIVLTTLKITE